MNHRRKTMKKPFAIVVFIRYPANHCSPNALILPGLAGELLRLAV